VTDLRGLDSLKFFDSGCSISMSGVKNGRGMPGRLVEVERCEVGVRGFDGSCKKTNMMGLNEDGKLELL
jgi:hypothetical protein